jgi:hypothetical protein
MTKMNKTKAMDKKIEQELNSHDTRGTGIAIDFLMENPIFAVELQLSNLIETYGMSAVLQCIDAKMKKRAS